jgi:hypothetical protein
MYILTPKNILTGTPRLQQTTATTTDTRKHNTKEKKYDEQDERSAGEDRRLPLRTQLRLPLPLPVYLQKFIALPQPQP